MADEETTEAPRSADTDRRRAAGAGLVIQLIGTAAVVGLAWVMTRHYVRYLQQQAAAAAGAPAPCAGCAEKAAAAHDPVADAVTSVTVFESNGDGSVTATADPRLVVPDAET